MEKKKDYDFWNVEYNIFDGKGGGVGGGDGEIWDSNLGHK